MTPHKYTKDKESVLYHYKFSELRRFLTEGKKTGDVGLILISRDGDYYNYRGFGTIENPHTWITTLGLIRNESIDGQINDDLIVNPEVKSYALSSYSLWVEDITS